MPTENGVNYFRVAEAIASCATAPSSFACGSKLLPLVDERSLTFRRYRDLFELVCADLGGADRVKRVLMANLNAT